MEFILQIKHEQNKKRNFKNLLKHLLNKKKNVNFTKENKKKYKIYAKINVLVGKL